jgi:hypothetical protein
MAQADLINFHSLFQSEARSCDSHQLSAHYAHVLLALQALIESHGPTPEYQAWSAQSSPSNIPDHLTFVMDL